MARRGRVLLGLHRKLCFCSDSAGSSWLASPPVVCKEYLFLLFVNRFFPKEILPHHDLFPAIYKLLQPGTSRNSRCLHSLLGFPCSPSSRIGFLCWWGAAEVVDLAGLGDGWTW